MLQRAHQLVIGGGVLLLLAQAIDFIDEITIADAGQLRGRTARLQLRTAEEALCFGRQSA